MSRRACLTVLCILLASGLTVQALQDSPNEKEQKALQGKWEVVSVDGKERKGGKAVATFEGGDLTFTPKMGDFSAFSFTLDASKTPKALDLLPLRKGGAHVASLLCPAHLGLMRSNFQRIRNLHIDVDLYRRYSM